MGRIMGAQLEGEEDDQRWFMFVVVAELWTKFKSLEA